MFQSTAGKPALQASAYKYYALRGFWSCPFGTFVHTDRTLQRTRFAESETIAVVTAGRHLCESVQEWVCAGETREFSPVVDERVKATRQCLLPVRASFTPLTTVVRSARYCLRDMQNWFNILKCEELPRVLVDIFASVVPRRLSMKISMC